MKTKPVWFARNVIYLNRNCCEEIRELNRTCKCCSKLLEHFKKGYDLQWNDEHFPEGQIRDKKQYNLKILFMRKLYLLLSKTYSCNNFSVAVLLLNFVTLLLALVSLVFIIQLVESANCFDNFFSQKKEISLAYFYFWTNKGKKRRIKK